MDTVKVKEAIAEVNVVLAFQDDLGNVRKSRKRETEGLVADIVNDACRDRGIEPDSEEYEAIMAEILKYSGASESGP